MCVFACVYVCVFACVYVCARVRVCISVHEDAVSALKVTITD